MPAKRILLISFPIVFIFGIFVGFLGGNSAKACKQKYSYLNKDFRCEAKHAIDKSNPIGLRGKLNSFIEEETKVGRVNTVSLYFRDLHEGPTLGVNEGELFAPASLLKIPTALTFFKLAEETMPDILTRKLSFKGSEEHLQQFFQPTQTIQPGTVYSVEELIFNSLVYSDNRSNEVLKASLGSIEQSNSLILQTYRELGLIAPKDLAESSISIRAYASIFRMLYNISYLSADHSERILSMLAQSTFDQGIVAGVPQNTKVANKFGERFIGEEKQLHDCGIIYFPQNPYLLCVMTRGKDFNELAGVISALSKMVYEEVDSRKIQ